MKNYLSMKETTFLRNPEQFNNNYRYVLTHRIKKKQEAMNNTLSVIKKYERALLKDYEKTYYDEKKAFEQKHKEYNKNLSFSISIFSPNIQTQHDISKLKRNIALFEKSLKQEKMTDEFKKQAKSTIDKMKKGIDERFIELYKIFRLDNELIG